MFSKKRKFNTHEQQRDYTANQIINSPDKLTQFAGRIALTSPLPPNVKGHRSPLFRGGIETGAIWTFEEITDLNSRDNKGSIQREALTIMMIGKKAGQLSFSATLEEKNGESYKMLDFNKYSFRDAEIASSEGLANQEEQEKFIEGFVEDMEYRVLRYDTPSYIRAAQSLLDHRISAAEQDDATYFRTVGDYYADEMEDIVKKYRRILGISESGDPTI